MCSQLDCQPPQLSQHALTLTACLCWCRARRGGASLSPAARTFMRRMQGRTWAHVDAQLRATYGHRTPGSSVRDAPLATPPAPVAASPAAAGLLGEMTPERRHT